LVLVVDDDQEVARLLEESVRPAFNTRSVTTGRAALDVVAREDIGVILADQRMPDMEGLELLGQVRTLRPTTVGVLITAHADMDAAILAINSARVLGFLTKPWDDDELLLVLRRAMDAHLALVQLNRASQEPERELQLLERFASGAPVPVTARGYGAAPLRETMPEAFAALTERYADVLGLGVEQRWFKVDHHTSDALHEIADRLGGLSAGARDVIDLHLAAVRLRLAAADGTSGAIADEARLLVLELMGHLVTYYRNHTLGIRL
jgi:CheY-like chemotaxis protein